MVRSLAAVAFSVPDYDEAIAWFADALGFELIEDTPLGDGKRWVVVAASRNAGARLVLQQTEGARRGNRRVGYFLETDDFDCDHAAYLARGVRFSRRRGGNPMEWWPCSPIPGAANGI